ncbi:hypothetical protein [Plantactinospora endophytica]|uniref:Nephrocystin 3-like N-terminal domain-containing protein n=1 Tax=Plantactinospora endophytica TaxID=673535 RepID=A0ABQ4EET3_9ACTN|nr:hypothetical protein [Plantactinospora endophytica]GIG93169.1 hypothetical protein Pen02_81050 [Plantactinospora endophytica]
MILGKRQPAAPLAVGDGAVSVGGDNAGPITTNVLQITGLDSRWAAQPVYLEQVRRIAPPELLDREAELAELTAFCTEAGRGPYAWWRADAWAGKSALLSTFVLHPPAALTAAGVQIASFFITAWQAGQDTREAFTKAVLGQLCSLTGNDLPTVADDGTRETLMLTLLREAAAARQEAGGRLVLVVDGLDEERDASLGPYTNSIAGLLPADPPHGMRVIVAGRPNPPLPADVPGSHPLGDPRIIRRLDASPHAGDKGRLSRAELRRILKGSEVERDLLGLLAASRGGLSQADLRELTGADLLTVEDVLHTVAGRTFTRRGGVWSPEAGEVYLLGHEELQRTAVDYLGPQRLAAYRERLHVWADTYRGHDGGTPWPPNTPEYLLRDYPRMLAEIGATERLIALATDTARQDRMLDLSGGDAALLNEILEAQNLIMGRPEPDLAALARLSRHRAALQARNAAIPTNLPALWATLGHPVRAESLAHSIPNKNQQVQALAETARARAAAGDRASAARWATDAAQVALTITDPIGQARAFAEVAGAMAAAEDRGEADRWAQAAWRAAAEVPRYADRDGTLAGIARTVAIAGALDQAELIAASVTAGSLRSQTIDVIARIRTAVSGTAYTGGAGIEQQQSAAVTAGDPGRAEEVALGLRRPSEQAQALAAVALAAAAEDHERARTLAVQAERIARAISSYDWDAAKLTVVARAVAIAGDADRAERIANALADPDRRIQALSEVAVAAAGDPDRAERIAGTIPAVYRRALALAAVAETVAGAGDRTRAATLARAAEQVARTVPAASQQAQALTAAARAAAVAGDSEHAETIACRIPDPGDRVSALVEVVGAGRRDRALSVAFMAEEAARTVIARHRRTRAMALVAKALAAAGDQSRGRDLAAKAAEEIAPSSHGRRETSVLVDIAGALVAAGDVDHALQIAVTMVRPGDAPNILAEVARALAADGYCDRAENVINSLRLGVRVVSPEVTEVARLVAAAGDNERAERIARRVDPAFGDQERALAAVAVATAPRDPRRAEAVAGTITRPDLRAETLAEIAHVMGLPAGRQLYARAFILGSWLTPLPALAELQPGLVLRITEGYGDNPSPTP